MSKTYSAIAVLFPGRTYKNMWVTIRNGDNWYRHKLSLANAKSLALQLKVNLDAHEEAKR